MVFFLASNFSNLEVEANSKTPSSITSILLLPTFMVFKLVLSLNTPFSRRLSSLLFKSLEQIIAYALKYKELIKFRNWSWKMYQVWKHVLGDVKYIIENTSLACMKKNQIGAIQKVCHSKIDIFYPLPMSHFVIFRLGPPLCHTLKSDKLWAENGSKFDVNSSSHICQYEHISYTKYSIVGGTI